MIIKTLITKDTKGDFRFMVITKEPLESGFYKINRCSGKLGGAVVQQPPLLIKKGKVNRTIEEQATLEFNSLITKALSKGYKDATELTNNNLEELTEDVLNEFFGIHKTDMQGVPKPMLAKETSNAKPAIWQKHYKISKKLDGVRCMLYWDNINQEVRTASRGGKIFFSYTSCK